MALIKVVRKGVTDQSVNIRIVDADGVPKTDVVFNSAGIDLWYRRDGAAVVSITEVTQTASGAHTDGGVVHLANGVYRLDLPDAAVASGVDAVEVGGTVTGGIIIGGTIQLLGVDLQDTVRAGLTALPNAAPGANTGLPTVDASNRVTANVTQIEGSDATDQLAAGAAAALTAYDPPTNAEMVARTLASASYATASGVSAVETDTQDIQARLPAALVSGRMASDAIAISGDTAAADALEVAFDGTPGPVPELGIIDQGTAQSASGTGLVLRSAAAFADDVLKGAVIGAFGSTQGYWQFRAITGNALSGDTVTVDAWTVTPSGTITYKIFGAPPASVSLPVPVNVTAVGGQAVTAQAGENFNAYFDNDDADTAVIVDDVATGGSGLDAAGVRAAIGMASANLDTQLSGVQSDTNDIQARLPAALVSGRMDASVGAMASGVVTATAIASNAITSAKVADDTITAAKIAANAIANAKIADGAITAAKIATDAIAGAKLAADAVTKIQAGLATAADLATVDTVVDTIAAAVDTEIPAILTAVDTEVASIKSTTDQLATALENDGGVYRFTTNALENAPTGGGGGAADWTTGEKEQIRHRLGLDGDADAPSATPSLATAASVAAVETDTQDLQARLPSALIGGRMNSTMEAVNGVELQGAGVLGDEFRPA